MDEDEEDVWVFCDEEVDDEDDETEEGVAFSQGGHCLNSDQTDDDVDAVATLVGNDDSCDADDDDC